MAILALNASAVHAQAHYGLSEEDVDWATTWYLDNGPAIYDAIRDARQLGQQLGAQSTQDALDWMRGNEGERTLEGITGAILRQHVRDAINFGTAAFEALAERYHVRKLVVIRDILEDELPDGCPVTFLYNPADDHTISDYIILTRELHYLVGYPVCLLNRKTLFEQMGANFARQLELASYWAHELVPMGGDEDAAG